MSQINIAVIDYPDASKSAVFGLIEVITVANTIIQQLDLAISLTAESYSLDELNKANQVQVVVLPPCSQGDFYQQQSEPLKNYLHAMQNNGAILASACVGSFILANAELLDNKHCTTHWRLATQFQQCFPKAKLNTNAIIVNEGNIITAGGRMAWLDLAVEILSVFCPPTVIAQLSKEMVIDLGHREQQYYRQFMPKLDHGDELILKVQDHFNSHYAEPVVIAEIAEKFYVSARTLQRRFQKAQRISVIEYLQKLRLHNACQLIELTNNSIVEIAYAVGYQNVNAFRKVFFREYGLTPSDYRKRFSV